MTRRAGRALRNWRDPSRIGSRLFLSHLRKLRRGEIVQLFVTHLEHAAIFGAYLRWIVFGHRHQPLLCGSFSGHFVSLFCEIRHHATHRASAPVARDRGRGLVGYSERMTLVADRVVGIPFLETDSERVPLVSVDNPLGQGQKCWSQRPFLLLQCAEIVTDNFDGCFGHGNSRFFQNVADFM